MVDLNDQHISRLIPEIFDQMRNNQSNPMSFVSTPASISTQALLKEQEQLDKIIEVISNLNEKLRECNETDLDRIRETCRVMNQVLDKYIQIQSQASYIKALMIDDTYLKYIESGKSEEEYMSELNKELSELRRRAEEKVMPAPVIKTPTTRMPSNISNSRRTVRSGYGAMRPRKGTGVSSNLNGRRSASK